LSFHALNLPVSFFELVEAVREIAVDVRLPLMIHLSDQRFAKLMMSNQKYEPELDHAKGIFEYLVGAFFPPVIHTWPDLRHKKNQNDCVVLVLGLFRPLDRIMQEGFFEYLQWFLSSYYSHLAYLLSRHWPKPK
jgi:hypothetical protein